MSKEKVAATSLWLSADHFDASDGHFGDRSEETIRSRNAMTSSSQIARAYAYEGHTLYPKATSRRSEELREELLIGGGQGISSISAFAMVPLTPLMSILHKSGDHARKGDGRRGWSGEGSSGGAEDTGSFQGSTSAPSSPPVLDLSPPAKKSTAKTTTGESYIPVYERRARYGEIRGADATVATTTTATLKDNTLSPKTYYLGRAAAASAAARSPLLSTATFVLREEEEEVAVNTTHEVSSLSGSNTKPTNISSRSGSISKQKISAQDHIRSLASLDSVARKGREESGVESYARLDDKNGIGIKVRKRRADAEADKSFVALDNIVSDFRKHVDASFFSSTPAHANQSMAVSASVYSPFTGPLPFKEKIRREIDPRTPPSPEKPVAAPSSATASASRQTNNNYTHDNIHYNNDSNITNQNARLNLSNESHTAAKSNDHVYAEFNVNYSNNETTASYQRALEAHQMRCEETIRTLLREYDGLAKERAAMVRGLRDQEANHRGVVYALEGVISHLRRSLDTAVEENQRLRYENRMLSEENEQLARARESLMNYADASDLERVQLRGLLLKEMHGKVGGAQVVVPTIPTTSPSNDPSYSPAPYRQKYNKSQNTKQQVYSNECDGDSRSEEKEEEVDRTISHATHTNRREQDAAVGGGVQGGTMMIRQSIWSESAMGLRSPLPTSIDAARNKPFISPVKANMNAAGVNRGVTTTTAVTPPSALRDALHHNHHHMSNARVNVHFDQRNSSPHPQSPTEDSPLPQEGKGQVDLPPPPRRSDHFNLSPSPIFASSSSSPLRVERVVTSPSSSLSPSSPISIIQRSALRRTDHQPINGGVGLVAAGSSAPPFLKDAKQLNDDKIAATHGWNSSMAGDDFRKTFESFLNQQQQQQRHYYQEGVDGDGKQQQQQQQQQRFIGRGERRDRAHVASSDKGDFCDQKSNDDDEGPKEFITTSHRDDHRPTTTTYYSASDFSVISNTTTTLSPPLPVHFDGGIEMRVGEVVSRTKVSESSTLVLDERGCAPLASLRVFACDRSQVSGVLGVGRTQSTWSFDGSLDKATFDDDQDHCGIRQPFLKIARNEGAGARAAEGSPAGLFVAFYPLAWAWRLAYDEAHCERAEKNERDVCVREGARNEVCIGDLGKNNKTIDHHHLKTNFSTNSAGVGGTPAASIRFGGGKRGGGEAARDYEAAAEDIGTIVSSNMLYKQVSKQSSSLTPRRRVAQGGKVRAEGIATVSTMLPSEQEEEAAAVSKQIRSNLIHGRLTRVMRIVLEAHLLFTSAPTHRSTHRPTARSRPEHYSHENVSDLVSCSFLGLRCPGLLLYRNSALHHRSGRGDFSSSRPHSLSSSTHPFLLMHELLFIVAFERTHQKEVIAEEVEEEFAKNTVVDDENKGLARNKGDEVWKAKIRLVLQSTLRTVAPSSSGLNKGTPTAEYEADHRLFRDEGNNIPLTVNFLSEVTSGSLTRFSDPTVTHERVDVEDRYGGASFLSSSEDVRQPSLRGEEANKKEEDEEDNSTKHLSPALLWYLKEARLMPSANIKTSNTNTNNTTTTTNALFRPRLSTSASDFHTVEANLTVLKEEDVSFCTSSSSTFTSMFTNNSNKLPLSITYNDFTASVHLEARLGLGLEGARHHGGRDRDGTSSNTCDTSLLSYVAEDAIVLHQSSTILTSHFPLRLAPTEASEFAARLSKALLLSSSAEQQEEKEEEKGIHKAYRGDEMNAPSSRSNDDAKRDDSPTGGDKEEFAGLARLVRAFSSSSSHGGRTNTKSFSDQHACVENLVSYLRGDLVEVDVHVLNDDDPSMNGTNNNSPGDGSSSREGFHSAQPFAVLGLPQDAVYY